MYTSNYCSGEIQWRNQGGGIVEGPTHTLVRKNCSHIAQIKLINQLGDYGGLQFVRFRMIVLPFRHKTLFTPLVRLQLITTRLRCRHLPDYQNI